MPVKILRHLLVATLCAACAAVAIGARLPAPPSSPPSTLLRNVAVIDGTGSPPQPARDILLTAGRIARIGPTGSFESPPGTNVLDLAGRTVIPGLIDMHAHLIVHPRGEDGSIRAEWDRPSSLEMLGTLLAFGVTTVRDPGASTEEAVVLRDAVARGEVAGPRIFTAGRILISIPFAADDFVVVRSTDEVRREVAWQHAAGVDFIKVYSPMGPELVAAAIGEAHARGLRVVGHLGATSWREGAALGIDGIEHPASWSATELPEEVRATAPGGLFGRVHWLRHLDLEAASTQRTVRALIEHRVAVDPTLMAMHSKFWGNAPRYLDNPDHRFVPARVAAEWPAASFTRDWTDEQYAEAREQWPKLLRWVRLLADSGVLLTVGTDSPTPWIVPGAAVHDEMALLVDAGIEPLQVLRMATHNAAIALGRETDLGLVREGYVADLVVLAADPSQAIRKSRSIEWVVKSGVVLDLPSLSPPSRS